MGFWSNFREKNKVEYDLKTGEAKPVDEDGNNKPNPLLFNEDEQRGEVKMSAWFWIRIALCLYVAWIGAGLFRDGLKADMSTWYSVAGGAFVVLGIGIIVVDLRYYFKHKKEVEDELENKKNHGGGSLQSDDELDTDSGVGGIGRFAKFDSGDLDEKIDDEIN